jgi:hypothetical protein
MIEIRRVSRTDEWGHGGGQIYVSISSKVRRALHGGERREKCTLSSSVIQSGSVAEETALMVLVRFRYGGFDMRYSRFDMGSSFVKVFDVNLSTLQLYAFSVLFVACT